MLGHGAQAAGGIERAARCIQRFVGRVVDIDQNHVGRLLGRPQQAGVDIPLHHLEPGIRSQLLSGGEPALFEPRDHGIEKFDHLDPRNPGRGQRGVGRVAEPEPAHQDRQPLARMHAERDLGQAPLGFGVVAAHQEALVEGDLGDDHARARDEFAPAQAEFAQRGVLQVEDFEERGHQNLLEVPSIE